MKEDFTHIERIEKYLDGKMTASEKQSFESSMDAATKNAIENEMVVRKVVRGDRLISLKEQMVKDLATKGGGNAVSLWKPLVLGSLLVAALGGGYFFLKDNDQQRAQNEAADQKNIGLVSPEEESEKEIFSGSENAAQETPEQVSDVQNSVNEDSPKSSSNTEIEATVDSKKNSGVPSKTNDYAEPNSEQPATASEDNPSEASQANTLCNNVAIKALIFSMPSCQGDNNGKLFIFDNSVSGGVAPYTFSINNSNAQQNGEFSSLAAGEYTITIADQNGCKTEKTKVISTAKGECLDTDGYASFSPSKNETFNFPLPTDNSKVTVFDFSNKPVYQATIENKYHSSWDGTLDNGKTAPQGIYTFEVSSSGQQNIKGYVIIK